jgi:hypothetical protein
MQTSAEAGPEPVALTARPQKGQLCEASHP